MVAVVEEHGAAAAGLGVEAPGPGGEGYVPGGGAEAGVAFDADAEGVADFAGFDEGLGVDDARVEDEVFVDAQGAVSGRGSSDHLAGLGEGESHGFLDGDMLAGGEGVEGDGVVEVMGQEDFDEVEVGEGEEVVVVGEDAIGLHVPGVSAALGGLLIDVADGCELGAVVLEVFEGVEVADAAGADEAYAQHGKVVAPRLRSSPEGGRGSDFAHFEAAQID